MVTCSPCAPLQVGIQLTASWSDVAAPHTARSATFVFAVTATESAATAAVAAAVLGASSANVALSVAKAIAPDGSSITFQVRQSSHFCIHT